MTREEFIKKFAILGLASPFMVSMLASCSNNKDFSYELPSSYDGKASKYYIKHVIQNWSTKPFIQGAYSKRKGDVKKMATPVADKIYFAGEAMNIKGNTIAVHGASESAYLMLQQMLKSINQIPKS